LFISESSKLKNIISQFLKNSEELSLPEIIEVYYQVINVKSLSRFLRSNLEGIKNIEEEKLLLIGNKNIEGYIDENFDRGLHPLIVLKLKKSVDHSTKKLKDITARQSQKTKEDLEIQAKMYENLRQIMSTKEFVDQYNKGLNNTFEN
jgi:hypothetical protein